MARCDEACEIIDLVIVQSDAGAEDNTEEEEEIQVEKNMHCICLFNRTVFHNWASVIRVYKY